MGFYLAKVILYLLLPPASILIIIGFGLLLQRRYSLVSRVLVIAGFFLLYLLSIEPVSNTLIRPLERFAPPLQMDKLDAEAVVILSGGVIDLSWLGLAPEPSDLSLRRLVYGIDLYRKLKIPLIISGGSGSPVLPKISEGQTMADFAISLGVSENDIEVEGFSRNTIENARNVREMFKGNVRIILVTSAFHMKRAYTLFKRQGLDVIPAPCDFRSEKTILSLFSLIPNANALEDSSIAIYEYLGLIWYTVLS